MKKIVLTFAALLSLTLAQAATPKTNSTNAENAVNYDMTVNYNSLAVALHLDADQYESVKYIHDRYVDAMNNIAKQNIADKQALVRKTTERELASLRNVLDRDQLRTYTMLINTTLVNRGLID